MNYSQCKALVKFGLPATTFFFDSLLLSCDSMLLCDWLRVEIASLQSEARRH